MRRVLGGLLLSAAAFVGPGCGENERVLAPGTRVTIQLSPTAFTDIAPGRLAFQEVRIARAGTVAAVADWTLATNVLGVFLTAASCAATDASTFHGCAKHGASLASAKPETLSVEVDAGLYRVWVVNYGYSAETGTLQVTTTVAW
jgi:hypothetical protein